MGMPPDGAQKKAILPPLGACDAARKPASWGLSLLTFLTLGAYSIGAAWCLAPKAEPEGVALEAPTGKKRRAPITAFAALGGSRSKTRGAGCEVEGELDNTRL